MVKKEDVLDCYRFLLDRLPENDGVVEAKCRTIDLETVVADIVAGEEFLKNHKVAIARYILANRPSK